MLFTQRRRAVREAAVTALREFYDAQQLTRRDAASADMWAIIARLEVALDALFTYTQAVEDTVVMSHND